MKRYFIDEEKDSVYLYIIDDKRQNVLFMNLKYNSFNMVHHNINYYDLEYLESYKEINDQELQSKINYWFDSFKISFLKELLYG